MASPTFLDKERILSLHKRQMEFFGGKTGVRDAGLLDSAVHAPIHYFLYENHKNLFDLAACYAFHLVKNHPFNDGNKRVGFDAAGAFLKVNGIPIKGNSSDNIDAMLKLTTSEITKAQFADFLRNIAPLEASILADLYLDAPELGS